jgi:hypothetical protein
VVALLKKGRHQQFRYRLSCLTGSVAGNELALLRIWTARRREWEARCSTSAAKLYLYLRPELEFELLEEGG